MTEKGTPQSGASGARRPWVALIAATFLELEPLLDAWGVTQAGHHDGLCAVEVAYKPWYVFSKIPGSRGANAPRDNLSMGAAAVVTGYDKTNAAHALTSLLERAEAGRLPGQADSGWEAKPSLVLQFGIAGAFPQSGIRVGDVVVATEEVYGDTGASAPGGWLSTESFHIPLVTVAGRPGWNRFILDQALAAQAVRMLTQERLSVSGGCDSGFEVKAGRCITMSCVTGTQQEADELWRRWKPLAESMEGAAAAHVCSLYQVPFLEVRAISNLVGDRERESWDVGGAAARAARAAACLVARLEEVLAPLGEDKGGR